jgi:tRNA pseudouridine32 synthase/23S rRNA pseudouridine746 synthase/23S rRNA pseudouridine1911/1915/1917 synthase
LTGTKNQIRVHLSNKGCPVADDKKYGIKENGIKRLMLHAAAITIAHPYSKEKVSFTTEVPASFDSLLKTSQGTPKSTE